jgi:hypothetical protein
MIKRLDRTNDDYGTAIGGATKAPPTGYYGPHYSCLNVLLGP